MDYSTLIGLLSSLAMIGVAIALDGHLAAFANAPSLLIVLGGTMGVILTSYSFGDMVRTAGLSAHAFTHETPDFKAMAMRLIQLAQKNRAGPGLLGLQKDAQSEAQPFLRQALSLAVDGAPADVIEKILTQDTVSLMDRHERALAVLRRGAEVAPAMGLISTLIGLVHMLGNLSDPASIGPAMAVAILGTFYGAMFAYVIFTPLATKLERTAADDLLIRKLVTMATLSLIAKENPRQLELHLNSVLPPALRISMFR